MRNKKKIIAVQADKLEKINITTDLIISLQDKFGKNLVKGVKDSSGDINQTKAFLKNKEISEDEDIPGCTSVLQAAFKFLYTAAAPVTPACFKLHTKLLATCMIADASLLVTCEESRYLQFVRV